MKGVQWAGSSRPFAGDGGRFFLKAFKIRRRASRGLNVHTLFKFSEIAPIPQAITDSRAWPGNFGQKKRGSVHGRRTKHDEDTS